MRNSTNSTVLFDAVAVRCDNAGETGMDLARISSLLDARFYPANPRFVPPCAASSGHESVGHFVETPATTLGMDSIDSSSLHRGPLGTVGKETICTGLNPVAIRHLQTGINPLANLDAKCDERRMGHDASKRLRPSTRQCQWSVGQSQSPSWQVVSAEE